jgi:hypothetical protein
MSREELEGILLLMLIHRPEESNALAQALADVRHVKTTVDHILRVSAARTADMIADMTLEIAAADAARNPNAPKA